MLRQTGFTLAELLIALAILGVIATFTIPKILTSQQNAQKVAIAKEAAAMIAGAYQQAQLQGVVTTNTSMSDLSQYMNYVSVDTTSTLDAFPNAGQSTVQCAPLVPCLRLHNGAVLLIDNVSFATTNGYIDALIDPDGRVTSQKDSIVFLQAYNGQIVTAGSALVAPYDPTWFNW